MNVSTPIKVFALVALFAAVSLGGGMMFLMPSDELEAEPASIVVPKQQQAGTLTPSTAQKQAPAKAAAPAKAKPKAVAAPAAKPKPAPVVAANGLPMQIATALQRHDVVVVSLWGSGAKIDTMGRDEAQAGAAAARAGFVSLNVIESQRAAEALTLMLDQVLSTPAVLIYKSPDQLVNVLPGFRDRETVAQAAINGLR